MATESGLKLTQREIEALLARGITARLACTDADGLPYIVPLWHEWDGQRFWVIASEGAKWVAFLRDRPAVALLIDEPDTSRLLCQGRARIVEGPSLDGDWVPIAHSMVRRYLGEDQVEPYTRNTAGLKRWLIAIDPTSIVTWRGPSRTD